MEGNLSKFSLLFILGIGISSFLPIPFFIYLIFIILLLIILCFNKNFKKEWLILGGIFLFGIFWYQFSFPKVNSDYISFYNNQTIFFEGRVIKEVDKRIDKDKLFIGDIKINNREIKGLVLVSVGSYSPFEYGDLLKIDGYIQEPTNFNDFNYKMYLARYNVYSVSYYPEIKKIGEKKSFFYKNILKIRQKSKKIINKFLPEPQSSILGALLLGYKKSFPDNLRNNFAMAGVSHILAISGLHIAILISVLMVLFAGVLKMNSSLSFILTLVFIALFVILVGAPSSAVRAFIMGGLLLVAQRFNKTSQSLKFLLLAAFLMLLFNPKLLIWDISFQFSFLAVLGIYFLTPLFKEKMKKIPNPICSYLSVSLGAQVMVLPLVMYYFNNLSLIAPISNILVLFTVPFLMIFGFLFLIFSLVSFGLSIIFLIPIFLLLTYVLLMVKILSQIPYLSFVLKIGFPLFGVIIFYFILGLIIVKNYKIINNN